MEEKTQKKGGKRYQNFIELILVGSVTGVFAGAVVTLYNVCAKFGEEISQNAYAFLRANPAFLPLLFLVLALGAFLLSAAVYFVPMAKGSGLPQVEGATRGVLRFTWWKDATVMFAASLLSIFMGLSVGSEGPSLHIGAASGDGVAMVLKRREMIRRYQVTGGACVGLAAAFNAPLTGVAFAFEEAHKRFTPEVFICAFSSVIFGLITRTLLYDLFGWQTESFFHNFAFPQGAITDWKFFLFLVISAIVCGLVGVLFYKLVFLLRSGFEKIAKDKPFLNVFLRILIVVILGGVASLVTVNVMGGGKELIESFGTRGGAGSAQVESVFSLPIVLSLLVVCLLKLLLTGANLGAGLPGGAFIPMLAIGGCVGYLLSLFWVNLGMDPAYCDLLVMVCTAAFFTTVVKAPITGVVMVCELTWSFAFLLPVVVGVAIGYVIGDIARTESIYEHLLEKFVEEQEIGKNHETEQFTLRIEKGALAEKREIRNVLWPAGVRVIEILRGERRILPHGETELLAGDVLTVLCTAQDPKKALEDLKSIVE